MALSDADTNNSAMSTFTDDKSGSDDVRGMADLPSLPPRAPPLTLRQFLVTTH